MKKPPEPYFEVICEVSRTRVLAGCLHCGQVTEMERAAALRPRRPGTGCVVCGCGPALVRGEP